MVTNGGFESGLWTERTGTSFSIDNTVYRSGGQSLKVTGTSSGKYITSAAIPVNPYEGYQVDVWVKSDLADSRAVIGVGLLPVSAANQALGWYPGGQAKWIDAGGGRQNWTRYTATVNDLPAATANVKIYLLLDAGASGEVWFDDVTLESVNLAPDGGFETGLWSNNNGFARDTTEKHSGLSSARIVGQSTDKTMYSSLVPIRAGERYTLSLWIKTDQISIGDGISVSVLQVNGSNQALGWYGGTVKLLSTDGTQGWTKVTADLSGFTAGTENLRLYVRSDGGITGTAWFDDVRLSKRFRDGFLWGINGHLNAAYPVAQLNNQLQKAVDLGVSVYRINVNPGLANGVYDWTELDQVVDAAYNKGLKIVLVLYSMLAGPSAAGYEAHGEAIAARYRGKISYYQIGNENDNKCILGSDRDGSLPSHYDPVKYAEVRDKIVALGNGIISGDPYAKRMINIGYRHTAFLEMLQADGVEWEVNGLDWYSNMGNIANTLNKLQTYPQTEILIAESNIHNGTLTNTEQEQADYLTGLANQVYYEAPSKVKGFIVYELLDEPANPAGGTHYGLIDSSGAEKLAYGAYRHAVANKWRD